MKVKKKGFLKLGFLLSALALLTACISRSRDNLYAYADEETLSQLTGESYFIKLDLEAESERCSNEGVLTTNDREYGYFQVYKKVEGASDEKIGTEFWISDIKSVEANEDKRLFTLIFADNNGGRIELPDNQMIFHGKDSISVAMNPDFPLSPQYVFSISTINDYPLPIFQPKKSSLLIPGLRNYAHVYVPVLSGWVEWLLIGLVFVVLGYLIYLRAWLLFQYFALAYVLVLGGGIYFSWLVFMPLVIPVFLVLPMIFFPKVAKKARTFMMVLSVLSFIYCALRLCHIEGIWLGAWKSFYIYMFSQTLYILGIDRIFDKVCPRCGNLLFDNQETNPYCYEGDEMLYSGLNCNGDSLYQEQELKFSEEQQKEVKSVCYWCADDLIQNVANDDDDEDDYDDDNEDNYKMKNLSSLYVK